MSTKPFNKPSKGFKTTISRRSGPDSGQCFRMAGSAAPGGLQDKPIPWLDFQVCDSGKRVPRTVGPDEDLFTRLTRFTSGYP